MSECNFVVWTFSLASGNLWRLRIPDSQPPFAHVCIRIIHGLIIRRRPLPPIIDPLSFNRLSPPWLCNDVAHIQRPPTEEVYYRSRAKWHGILPFLKATLFSFGCWSLSNPFFCFRSYKSNKRFRSPRNMMLKLKSWFILVKISTCLHMRWSLNL